MGLPVKVFRWDDAGAPSLGTSKPSEIINILKKCLVTGYGVTTPLGWTIIDEVVNNRNIMFRTNVAGGGSGGCVSVRSYNNADTAGNTMWYQPCRTASSITAMTNKGYICATQFPSYISYDVWQLVGTAAGFFLIIGKSVNSSKYGTWANSDESVVYCGDYKPAVDGDVSRTITYSEFYGSKNASTGDITPQWPLLFGTARLSALTSGSFRIYDSDGATNKYNEYRASCGFSEFGTEDINHNDPVGDERVGSWWVIASTGSLCSPNATESKDRMGTPRPQSGLSPYLRGRLFGLVEVEMGRWSNQTWPFYKEFNGQTHLALRSATGGVSTFLNLVEW